MRYATSFALAVVLYAGICSIALKPPPPGEGKRLYEVTLIPAPDNDPEESPTPTAMPFMPSAAAESGETPEAQTQRDMLAFDPTVETASDPVPIEDPPHVYTPHPGPLPMREDNSSIFDVAEAASDSVESERVVGAPVTLESLDSANNALHAEEDPSIHDAPEAFAESVGSQTVVGKRVFPEREATNNTPPVEEDTSILDVREPSSDLGKSEPVVDEPVAPEHHELPPEAPPVAFEHHDPTADAPTVAADPLDPAVDLVADAHAHLELPDNLMQLPDLVIKSPPDESDWSVIDKNLGIVTVAYSIDGRQPTIHLVWHADGSVERAETLDRSGFSNRCRNRSQIEFFRRRLLQAKQQFGIQRPLRIVGLVPVETDRRFALAQTLVIQSEGFDSRAVAHTLAHYDLSAESRIRIDDLIKR